MVGVDKRPASELDLGALHHDAGLELAGESALETLPGGVDGVVLSPGVPLGHPLISGARASGVPVIAEVELASVFAEGPLVGITGSNGKSTTTRMTGEILESAGIRTEVCGNIGVPLSAVVEGPTDRVFVVELSSFQLESVDTFHPAAAALLNLSPDHLDRHRDEASYFAAKLRLFDNQNADDIAVLNADDERVASVDVRGRRRLFSRRGPVADGCYLDGDVVVEVDPGGEDGPLFARRDLPLPGVHNLENAMAAALLSRAMGADPVSIASGLSGFEGLPHRLQKVGECRGVAWYDDSKATNFAATVMSLAGFADDSIHLILGGRNKGGDPTDLIHELSRKARRIYLIGEAAEEIARDLAGVVPAELCGTMEAAVAAAARRARPGEVVLLSPCCASFDQYRDFAARGDHFQSLVRGLDG